VTRLLPRVAAGALFLAVVATLATAMTASNTVPATRLGQLAPVAINAQALAPAACAGMGLTGIYVVTGDVLNELVLGTAAGETVSGGKLNDCLIGGGGNDAMDGENGTDVCIGGPGTDTFVNACETQIQ